MPNPEEEGPPPGETPPLAVKASTAATIQAVLISLAVASATVLGAIGSVLSFWKARDLAGAIYWLRSSDALSAITALVTIAGVITIINRAMRRKWREVFLARNAPDNIAYIVGEQLPTSGDSRGRNGNTRLVSIDAVHPPVAEESPELAELARLMDREGHISSRSISSPYGGSTEDLWKASAPDIPGDALNMSEDKKED